MKIVLFCRYFSPEFEYMENAFARQFLSEGHQVTILTTTRLMPLKDREILAGGDAKTELPAGTTLEDGVTVVRLQGRYYGSHGGFEMLPGFAAAIKHLKPDLLFFQSLENYPLALQAAMLKYRYGYRYYVVVNEHFIYALGNELTGGNPFKEQLKKWLSGFSKRTVLLSADRIINMNEYSAEVARRFSAGSAGKMVDVTLGVDLQKVLPRPESRQRIRQQYSIKEEEILLVHSGKMAPYKKTHVIVEALARLHRRDLKLLLIGKCEAEYRLQIDRLVEQNDLHEQILFIPWVDANELHHYFSAADIAVWVDHATISTLEASAVGIPVIVPDFHGYEHRTGNNNGLRIIPGDLDDLTGKLLYLVENAAERQAMGRRGRELVEKELNWTAIVDKILT